MSSIIVSDLSVNQELDRGSLRAIRGGYAMLPGLGLGNPNINVNINQSVAQLQNISVNTLNYSNLIGVDLSKVKVNVVPTQWGGNFAAA
jgi:hypothetical protein